MATQTTLDAVEGEQISFARHVPAVARILMGLLFFVFGLNGFLNFIPQPKTPMPEGAAAFAGALMKTGYMFPLVMALITPIIVGIITFHVFLAPSGMAPGIVALVLDLYLAWAYRGAFRPMLALR